MSRITKISPRKIIVITAPSGAGKSTLKNHVLDTIDDTEFSISYTNRKMRANEIHGKDYWFGSDDDFQKKIANGEFIEYEEVYPGRYYGTLFSEIKRITEGNHHHIILDVDVKGAVSIKQKYPESKIILIMPPSLEILKKRLEERKDTEIADMEIRLTKAPIEMEFGEEMVRKGIFDVKLLNSDLHIAKSEIITLVQGFITQPQTI